MADLVTSDEERYANESFELESDTEIPEISDSDSDTKSHITNNSLAYNHEYSRNYLKNRRNYIDLPIYDSSTDEDEDDVVISKTVAEINTKPMLLDSIRSSTSANSKYRNVEPSYLELPKEKYKPKVKCNEGDVEYEEIDQQNNSSDPNESVDFEDEYDYEEEEQDGVDGADDIDDLDVEVQNETEDETDEEDQFDDANDDDYDVKGNDDYDVKANVDDYDDKETDDDYNVKENDDDYDYKENDDENYSDEDNEMYENASDNENDSETEKEIEINNENIEKELGLQCEFEDNIEETVNEFESETEFEEGLPPISEAQETLLDKMKDISAVINNFESMNINEFGNIQPNESDIIMTSKMFAPSMHEDKLADIDELQPEEYVEKLSSTPSTENCFRELSTHNDAEAVTATETETEVETETNELNDSYQYKYKIQRRTPSVRSFDCEARMDIKLVRKANSTDQFRFGSQNRKSWSFSNERVREIGRQNQILLKKIITQKPTYASTDKKKTNSKFAALPPTTRVSTAAINRKKQQRQIDLDNQVLKRKIEAISLRRPVF